MKYAQLDFTDNNIKRVNLIGGEEVGIVQSLIGKYPTDFVNLEGRENVPLDTFDWYYNAETDTFIQTNELPMPEESVIEPTEEELTNAQLLLNQADIMSKQSEHDEILAEILLNMMEV